MIHFVTPRSRRNHRPLACGGNLNLPWLLHSVVPYGSRSGLTTGSYAYGMLTCRHVGPRERPWPVGRVGSAASPADAPPPFARTRRVRGHLSAASHQVENNKAHSHQGKEDKQVPENFHR